MTKNFLKTKIKEIEKSKINAEKALEDVMREHDRLISEHNALCGAEQAYQEMLAELERTEKREGCQEVKNE